MTQYHNDKPSAAVDTQYHNDKPSAAVDTQYHNDKPDTASDQPATPKTQPPPVQHQQFDNLRRRVMQQDQEIHELKRQIRKLQNDLRTAVAAFNGRNHG